MTTLRRVKCGAPVDLISSTMAADGAVILEDFLSSDQLDRLNADVDPLITRRSEGASEGTDGFIADFFGKKTKRITGLVTSSEVFRSEILAHDQLLDYLDALLTHSDSYWLTTAQVIEIQPGEKAQYLHRDLENYPLFRELGPAGPECTVNCLIALSDFTDETGGTRLIPGSHKWSDFNDRGRQEMTIPIEMKAGSAVLYSGKVVHGGGANRSDRPRRALTMPFVLGWLAPEEAYPFYVPVELARTLPRRAQQLIGFRSFHNTRQHGGSLWQIDYEELADYLKMDGLAAR